MNLTLTTIDKLRYGDTDRHAVPRANDSQDRAGMVGLCQVGWGYFPALPGWKEIFMNPHETLTYNEPARKVVPYPVGHVLIYPSTLPNTVVLNMTNAIQVDGTGAG